LVGTILLADNILLLRFLGSSSGKTLLTFRSVLRRVMLSGIFIFISIPRVFSRELGGWNDEELGRY
jgi:hypothetical protein